MTPVPSDLGLVARAVRASGSWRARLIATGALLLTGGLPVALRSVFPEEPAYPVEFLVAAGLLLWVLWASAGMTLTRQAALDLAGDRPSVREMLSGGIDRLPVAVALPLLPIGTAALLAAFALGLLQVARVPAVGLVLVFVVLPPVLLTLGLALSLLSRFLLAGHLAAGAAAIDSDGTYGALSRGLAYAGRGPVRTILLRGAGLLLAVVLSLPRLVTTAVSLAGVYGALHVIAPERLARIEGVFIGLSGSGTCAADQGAFAVGLCAVLLAAWLGAGPVAGLYGARAGQYLAARRRLDGVPPDESLRPKAREKTLAELGGELVERLEGPSGGPVA